MSVGRPRFYGGSLLKVQITRIRCPGTFSQSIAKRCRRDTLCVNFVAILRARDVGMRTEVGSEIFNGLRSGSFSASGLGRKRAGAWEVPALKAAALAARDVLSSRGERHKESRLLSLSAPSLSLAPRLSLPIEFFFHQPIPKTPRF